MSKILVIGGAGYIGSHICHALKERGHESIVMDDLSTGSKKNVRWSNLLIVDARDQNAVYWALHRNKPDGVIHLAALKNAAESMVEPELYIQGNFERFHSYLMAAGRLPTVLASSAAVYGYSKDKLTEKYSLAPANPYGVSKVLCEQQMLQGIVLRYFNVAGSGKNMPSAKGNLIPNVLSAIAKNTALDVFGDGSQVRDYIHVEDVATITVRAMEAALQGLTGTTVNVCTGHGTSVNEVLHHCQRSTGKFLKANRLPNRDCDPDRVVGDNRFCHGLFGNISYKSIVQQIESSWATAMK